jgi:S1-C subfamily serine protease
MENARFSRRQLLAGSTVALSVAAAGCSLQVPGTSGAQADETQSGPDNFPDEFTPPSENPNKPVADSELAQVHRDTVDSVAAVRIENSTGTAGGTAWVYDDNYLVTNEHVVRDSEAPFVRFNDIGWRRASVVGTDVQSDLAVVEARNKPDSATPLSMVADPVAVGTRVAAVGNPFGLTSSFTTGVVSGRNRNIDLPRSDFSIADGVQTDAALNPGNSGGPLVTLDGRVVGVVNAGQGDNVGFAISAAMTKDVVPSLIDDGEHHHSYLGVFLTDVTPALIDANSLGVTWGVYIDGVPEDGPAADALQGSDSRTTIRGQEVPVGGDVIVQMTNGDTTWSIQNSERLAAFLALETDPGDTIEITVLRNGERQTVDVELGRRSDADL